LNNEIDVIASVTVTSKAVNDSVIKAAELFKENIEEGAGQ
jgi:Na+-translocating ferredoxin:NAD+ oxidoreductase RnfG subunit